MSYCLFPAFGVGGEEWICLQVQLLTAGNPVRKIHVVGLHSAAFCEDGRCVIFCYEVEYVPAACYFEVPAVGEWSTIYL